MIGAIAGDIIGSAYEWRPTKSPDFELFTPRCTCTDDTVLTVAVADCVLHGKDYAVDPQGIRAEIPPGRLRRRPKPSA
ncbi:MAG: hypothetical protein Q7T04_02100 [Dehalococcoidia bacterium]|nr:hypothetical protein [Dehalococcoidia bacterium]